MSDRRKGGKLKGKAKPRSSHVRIHQLLRERNYAERVGSGSPVYLAAIMDYLAAQVLEWAGNAARDNKKTRIIPRHLQLAIRNEQITLWSHHRSRSCSAKHPGRFVAQEDCDKKP